MLDKWPTCVHGSLVDGPLTDGQTPCYLHFGLALEPIIEDRNLPFSGLSHNPVHKHDIVVDQRINLAILRIHLKIGCIPSIGNEVQIPSG